MEFKKLEINESLKRAIEELGFEEMMPIQEQTIPLILEGQNIIGEAETGTGKTAAFVLPVLNNINFRSGKTECLIVTPTRELAMQIVNEIRKLGKYMRPTYATLVGGMSIRDQVKQLSTNPSIIVGTLGRINDHLRSRHLHLDQVRYFILDEADEMLKEGFKEDITTINEQLPQNKQTLLFSATISKHILELSKTIMDHYQFISVKDKQNASIDIEQYYIVMKEKQKFKTLTKLLDVERPTCAIIFGRTKRRVDELSEALNKCGYDAAGLHGDLTQQQRNAVLKKFRDKQTSILVATDVAARGLDISNVTHVYNFDLPQEVEFYIHRIGRTGRAKQHGISYSFIKENEYNHIKRIEEETNVKIGQKEIPTSEEVWKARNLDIIDGIEQRLAEIDVTKTKEFATALIEQFGAERLVSVLIENLSKKTDINQVSLTGEPPVVVKKQGDYKSSNRRRDSKEHQTRGFTDRKRKDTSAKRSDSFDRSKKRDDRRNDTPKGKKGRNER